MKTQILTKREKECLDFVIKFLKKKGYSPTTRDVMKGMGWSSAGTASGFLHKLQEKGYLELGSRHRLITSVNVLGVTE